MDKQTGLCMWWTTTQQYEGTDCWYMYKLAVGSSTFRSFTPAPGTCMEAFPDHPCPQTSGLPRWHLDTSEQIQASSSPLCLNSSPTESLSILKWRFIIYKPGGKSEKAWGKTARPQLCWLVCSFPTFHTPGSLASQSTCNPSSTIFQNMWQLSSCLVLHVHVTRYALGHGLLLSCERIKLHLNEPLRLRYGCITW